MRFIDLHSHILPGVDDGASTLEETLAMLAMAHAGGTRGLVATPHCFLEPWNNTDPVVISNSFDRLTSHVAGLAEAGGAEEELGEMQLYLGAENYVSPEFFEALEEERVVSLNASRYLLVEFPMFLPPHAALASAERILHAGYFPVLAHVERYPFFQRGPKRLAQFVEMGCVTQVNASTFLGAMGRGSVRLARKLLDANLVHLIASDGHGTSARRPDLSRAAEALAGRYSEESVNRWMWQNAARILEDKPPLL